MVVSRKERLVPQLRAALEDSSGIEVVEADLTASFVDLGLDSLFMTQFSLTVQNTFKVKVTFRQLLDGVDSLEKLATFIDGALPPEAAVPTQPPPPAQIETALPPPAQPGIALSPAAVPALAMPPLPPLSGGASGTVQALVEAQLRLMHAQLEVLSGRRAPTILAPAPVAELPVAAAISAAAPAPVHPVADPHEEGHTVYDVKKAFGAIPRIHKDSDGLTPRQKARLEALIRRYTARTAKSKKFTQDNRARHADPRVVSGFRPALKEIVYPIVVERSAGCRLWDLDGNEYVDALNGFGSNFFGYQPAFITEALQAQIAKGYEVGPQTPLAAEVADLVCELTGSERAAFCNTGSEAVLGCMRIARTVTGRSLIAIFSGSYHGIFDEVLVRGTRKLRSVPAAPGILPNTVQNVLVLDYGTDESLRILRERAGELAAIMIEPVQSRRPDLQPREFMQECRKITQENGCALIFDEVITGFRSHPGGAQHLFGVRADLASYGKVVGAGLSIGVVAGKREWMDALDGGFWQFGDDSTPTVGVTYFAGTFVRHPLAMAAARASLAFIKQQGPALQEGMNARTGEMARELNAWLKQVGAPLEVRHFASLWKLFFTLDLAYGDLVFAGMRDRGLHIWDGFPCFLTMAHAQADIAFTVRAIKESVTEMQEAGFFPPRTPDAPAALDASSPPVAGARLGRDPAGNPAWYVPNPEQPGKFVKLEA